MNKVFYLHLSTLLGAIFLFGSIIFPYISWKVQTRTGDEKDNQNLKRHCLNIIKFQLLVVILFFISLTLFWYNAIINFKETEEWDYGLMLIPLLLYWGCTVFYPLFILLIIRWNKPSKLYYPNINLFGR